MLCKHAARYAHPEVTMLKIYGWKRSRAIRCIWTLQELGLEYEQVPLNPHAGETRTPDYLTLNPSGKIPTLVHDDFVLTESMAINYYLATAFPGTLLPKNSRELAKLQQWTSWAITELEPPMVAIMREGRRNAEQIDKGRIESWKSEVHQLVSGILEPHLASQSQILSGPAFTLADLNVASVVSSMPLLGLELTGHPKVAVWLQRCFARPAWQRAQEKST
jgi:glutathione S-transferase